MNRAYIEPILEAIPAARQEEARHYGVHPYFTRRPANVVRDYVERYSEEGDVVLDPFGGTGVTAIEAFLLGRSAIQNDLNPFANFIARNIADTTLPSTAPLRQAFERVEQICCKQVHEIEKDEAVAKRWLKKLPLPENIKLPRNSDAEFFYEMFTPRQLAGLALIKQAIETEKGVIHDLLLLAWSASVSKLNKTFLSAKGRAESRGGSSIFSIYRYKLAAESVELPIWETFHGRFLNVLAAKEEVLHLQAYRQKPSGGSLKLDSKKDFRVLAHDAATLDKVIKPNSVDYIFTDPPYGAFISYLDLSILWNHWLGFPVSDETRAQETIVGGEQKHSASVLAVEMILTFYKPAKVSKSERKTKSPDIANPTAVLSEAFDSCLNHGATSFTNEALFNQLVMELWQRRALNCLSLDRDEFIEQLEKRGWIYNTRSHLWSKLGQGKSFIGEMMLFED